MHAVEKSQSEDDSERPLQVGDQLEREDDTTPSSPGMRNMTLHSPSSPGEKTVT